MAKFSIISHAIGETKWIDIDSDFKLTHTNVHVVGHTNERQITVTLPLCKPSGLNSGDLIFERHGGNAMRVIPVEGQSVSETLNLADGEIVVLRKGRSAN